MRFLLSLRNALGLTVFESTIRGLCEAGDEVVCQLSSPGQLRSVVSRMEESLEGFTVREEPDLGDSPDAELATALRTWVDYLHYLEPELADALKYRDRTGRTVPRALKEQTDALGDAPELRRALAAGLRAVERSLEVSPTVVEALRREAPDAVLVSPLLKRGSPQLPLIRAARRLGIPSALLVASWDNLTTKGLIHEPPDLVTVWNEAQRAEAIELHGVPEDRIAVTGAPRFDAWFAQEPSATREQYCGRLGLPADTPHILYVGSSRFVAPDEADWIARWLRRIRSSGHAELHRIPVVFRPHPGSPPDQQEGHDRLVGMPGVVVDPPVGRDVVDTKAMTEYYDALHHAAVVVGINTSAMLEAAVVGRAVHVTVPDRFRAGQEAAPHFAHLHDAVVLTPTLDEHAAGLARALRGEAADETARRSEAFAAGFLRPHGLDRPATPIMVDALRRLAAAPVEPAGPDLGDLADTLRDLVVRKPRQRVRTSSA